MSRGQGQFSADPVSTTEFNSTSHPASDGDYPEPGPVSTMSQAQPYMDVHASHLSSTQPYGSHSAAGGTIPHYHPYHQPASAYAPAASYAQYSYGNGVTSPQSVTQPPATSMSGHMSAQLLPLPVSTHAVTQPGYGNTTGAPMQGYVYDTTGQMAPPGAKPRVTATLWEDEGSLCYQVEAKGVCVARREDNHMINGTKLLNVAGMTRGRRDGILKSEKIRHVVKIGPMHLKGVWIPFERALEFANKEKITDLLYPLFVHNIGGLLYHPSNQSRTNMVVQESQQRRLEGSQPPRTSQPAQSTPLHHQPMQSSTAPHASQSGSAHVSHRPSLDRAHTFPTPPASASSVMGVSNQGTSYEWTGQNINAGVSNPQPLTLDTGLSNSARSMPTTPATTPPGSNIHAVQQYHGQTGYDHSKPYYSTAPSSHPQYAQQPIGQSGMAGYGQPLLVNSYMKSDMGPPTNRATGAPSDQDPAEGKTDRYSHTNGAVGGSAGEPGQEHESEYVNDGASAYGARGSYTYTTNPSVSALSGDHHSQLGSDMTGSPSQQNGSGRMTPRTSHAAATQWSSGYHTPPRPSASNSLYNIVSNTRSTAGNGSSADPYSVTSSNTPAYSSSGMNGSHGGSKKRLRDDDDSDRVVRADCRGSEFEHKRRRTLTDAPVVGETLSLQPMKAGGAISRRR